MYFTVQKNISILSATSHYLLAVDIDKDLHYIYQFNGTPLWPAQQDISNCSNVFSEISWIAKKENKER